MKPLRILLTLCICLFSAIALTVTSAAYCNGDVNDDGIYSVNDAQLTLIFAAGVEEPGLEEEYAADINRDGYITTDDAVEILRIAADLSVAPPHEYTAWFTTKEATCTEDGSAYSECYICNDIFYKTIPATGHYAPEQNCTSGGMCMYCDTYLEPTGHSLVDGVCTQCSYSILKPNITYKGKSITFGSTPATVKGILGNPQEALTDTISTGKVDVYIYCNDYANLGIFTFIDNKLTQFYSNNNTSSVKHNNKLYSLKSADADDITVYAGDIEITQYIDTLNENGGYVYSYLATVGESYTFEDTTAFATNEKIVFHLSNGCRAINGVSPLLYSSLAHQSAYNHAYDMATNNYFNHYAPNGSGPAQRMEAVGIDWYAYGENIAAGYSNAYRLNNGWYNSEGHKEVMLMEMLENLGISIVYDANSDFQYYAVQNYYT